MTRKITASKKGFSADWLLRGALTKLGDTVDRFTGRRWIPSSSIATSELIERVKKLLDAEAKEVPGKGTVVPHNIKLKIQWDKFSTDAEESLSKLEHELLTAAADHINDSLYYTYAPLSLEVKPDYFIEGVKLLVSFDKFTDENSDVEMNVTVPAINIAGEIPAASSVARGSETYIARFEIQGIKTEKSLGFQPGESHSVGRIGSNFLVVNDVSVSKIHASVSIDAEGSLSVADTGSTNGTFINGERISYGKAVRLEDGDRVKFGTVEVTFEHVQRPSEIVMDDFKEGETTKIDEFEFKRRESSDPQGADMNKIPIPADTLKPNAGDNQIPESFNSEPNDDVNSDDILKEDVKSN